MASVLPLNQSIRPPRFQEADEYEKINSWRRRIVLFSTMTIVGVAAFHQLPGSLFVKRYAFDEDLLNAPNVFTPRAVHNVMDNWQEEPKMLRRESA